MRQRRAQTKRDASAWSSRVYLLNGLLSCLFLWLRGGFRLGIPEFGILVRGFLRDVTHARADRKEIAVDGRESLARSFHQLAVVVGPHRLSQGFLARWNVIHSLQRIHGGEKQVGAGGSSVYHLVAEECRVDARFLISLQNRLRARMHVLVVTQPDAI